MYDEHDQSFEIAAIRGPGPLPVSRRRGVLDRVAAMRSGGVKCATCLALATVIQNGTSRCRGCGDAWRKGRQAEREREFSKFETRNEYTDRKTAPLRGQLAALAAKLARSMGTDHTTK